jgi:hypothetical protein
VAHAHNARIPQKLHLRFALLLGDKPNGAKAHSSGEINLPSSQPTLSYRVGIATDAHPRVSSELRELLFFAGAAVCGAGLLRVGREAAREREVGVASRTANS